MKTQLATISECRNRLLSVAKHKSHSAINADAPGHPEKRQSGHLIKEGSSNEVVRPICSFAYRSHQGHDKEPAETTAH